MLTLSICSPSASPSDPKCQKVIGTEFAGGDVPAGKAAETAGTNPSTTSGEVVTVAVVGTSPSAGVTPPPATSTVVIKPRALKTKEVCHEKIFVVSVDPVS
jgi:hypothetical protein